MTQQLKIYASEHQHVEACQWFENGDHPEDEMEPLVDDNGDPVEDEAGNPVFSEGKLVRYFRNPDMPGQRPCPRCGRLMHDHGWIDDRRRDGVPQGGITVCPGDYVFRDSGGNWNAVKPETFEGVYEAI